MREERYEPHPLFLPPSTSLHHSHTPFLTSSSPAFRRYHVSARCRLSTEQELELLELCDSLGQKAKIVREIVESYDREKLNQLLTLVQKKKGL